MKQIHRKSPFWSLAGPFLAYLAIQWGVQFFIELAVSVPYIARAYAGILHQGEGTVLQMQDIMEMYLDALSPVFEKLLRYQVEIAGAAAFFTIFLNAALFLKDRRMEQSLGIAAGERIPVYRYWTVAVMGAAGCIAATCLMVLVQSAFYDAGYQETSAVTYSAGLPVQILVLALIIPASEELMFRGILYKRIRERQTFLYSAVCASIFFALMHTSSTQIVYTFLLGLMLSYVYEKFGSLKAPVLLHIVMNLGSVLFTWTGVFAWLAASPVRISLATIGGAFVCSVMYVLIRGMDAGKNGIQFPPDRENTGVH